MSTTSSLLPPCFAPIHVVDPLVCAELVEYRRERGIDQHDEVWEGVYTVLPTVDNEHQELASHLTYILFDIIGRSGLGDCYPGINVSDQRDDWESNYRCPDVACFRSDTIAQDRGTHWFGGPDFAIEIVSPYDRSREKLDFYAKIGTRELLIVDRDPWQLELFRLDGARLASVGVSTLAAPAAVASERTNLVFQLIPGQERPQIAVAHSSDGRMWTV